MDRREKRVWDIVKKNKGALKKGKTKLLMKKKRSNSSENIGPGG